VNVFRTIDEHGRRPVVYAVGRHPVALCPSCSRLSVTTTGSGWRDVINVVRTVVVTLSICVRRFVCEFEDCAQHTFDERFDGFEPFVAYLRERLGEDPDGDNDMHAQLLERLGHGESLVELLTPSDVALCSAACSLCSGRHALSGHLFEVSGHCFRHEPSLDPVRMQAFRMYEFVYLGDPDGAVAHRNL
jgi:hypothetical protein